MILMYHKVHPNSPTMWWVLVDDFYRQMSELSNKRIVYLDDYDPTDKNQVVITFDGIYKNIWEFALPILNHFGYPFELFVTADYIGKDNEFDSIEPNAPFANIEELIELVKGGGRLQWHTRTHLNLKEVIDHEIIHRELTVPKDIKELDSNGFNWFAYPHGEYNQTVVEEVKNKFKGAVSCFQGNDDDPLILNRLTVVNTSSFRENKIACIIASYNYGPYLIEAIESVLRQTILPNEILISDDCSDDETKEIGESYSKNYPTLISYNRNSENMGVVKHFNKAISLTSSEYIFFLGADNRILSNYIEETAKILDGDKNTAIAYTDYAFFGSRAKLMYEEYRKDRKGRIIDDMFYQINFPVFENRTELMMSLNKGNFIQGSSMFKRDAFDEVGGYLQTEEAEDFNIFKRILDKGWNAQKAELTNLEYRQHSSGQANNVLSLQNRMIFYKNQFLTLSKKKNSFERSSIFKVSYFIYRGYTYIYLNYNKPKLIFRKIKKVIRR